MLEITFRVREDAPAGPAIINLRRGLDTTRTQLNEGGLGLIPDPSDEAGDELDGVVRVRRWPRLVEAFFRDPGNRPHEGAELVRFLATWSRRAKEPRGGDRPG